MGEACRRARERRSSPTGTRPRRSCVSIPWGSPSCRPALLEHWRRPLRRAQCGVAQARGVVRRGERPGAREARGARRVGSTNGWRRAYELASRSGWRGEFLAAAFFRRARRCSADARPGRDPAVGRARRRGSGRSRGRTRILPRGCRGFREPLTAERRRCLRSLRGRRAASARAAGALFTTLPAAVARTSARGPLPCCARSRERRPMRRRCRPGTDARSDRADDSGRARAVSSNALRGVRRTASLSVWFRCFALCPARSTMQGRAAWRAGSSAEKRSRRPTSRRGERISRSNRALRFAICARTPPPSTWKRSKACFAPTRGCSSARSLTLRSGDGVSLRPFLDRESLERRASHCPRTSISSIRGKTTSRSSSLPPRSAWDASSTAASNSPWSECEPGCPASLAAVLAALIEGDGLAEFLEAVPEADPLIALFAACDGARIDFRLRREYRGYAAEIERVARRLARRVTRSRRSAELVLFLLGAGIPSAETPTAIFRPSCSARWPRRFAARSRRWTTRLRWRFRSAKGWWIRSLCRGSGRRLRTRSCSSRRSRVMRRSIPNPRVLWTRAASLVPPRCSTSIPPPSKRATRRGRERRFPPRSCAGCSRPGRS